MEVIVSIFTLSELGNQLVCHEVLELLRSLASDDYCLDILAEHLLVFPLPVALQDGVHLVILFKQRNLFSGKVLLRKQRLTRTP